MHKYAARAVPSTYRWGRGCDKIDNKVRGHLKIDHRSSMHPSGFPLSPLRLLRLLRLHHVAFRREHKIVPVVDKVDPHTSVYTTYVKGGRGCSRNPYSLLPVRPHRGILSLLRLLVHSVTQSLPTRRAKRGPLTPLPRAKESIPW
jgi:hypothetical protein